MIQAVSYIFKKSLEQNLTSLLSKDYIIREILQDFDEKTVSDFIERYVRSSKGKSVSTIPIIFGFPQDLQNPDGLVVVGVGAGQEDHQSMSHREGAYEDGYGETLIETALISAIADGKITVPLTKPIKEIEGIGGFMLPNDAIELSSDDANVFFIHLDSLPHTDLLHVGDSLVVSYETREGTTTGAMVGFTAREEVLVSVLSANEGTIFCLDAIIKACIISVRESLRSKLSLSLPVVSYTAIQPIDEELAPSTPNIIYSRDYAIVYTVSHSVRKSYNNIVEEINISNRVDTRED